MQHRFSTRGLVLSPCFSLSVLGCAADRSGSAAASSYSIDPGGPASCAATDDQQLAPTDITLFEVDSWSLLATVLSQPEQPLFWVGYDTFFPPSYSPGVSTTSITLAISARKDEPVIQHVDADGPSCAPTSVSVPVHVSLQSADGALQEQIDTALVFWSRSTAGMSAFLPASQLGGGFSFTSSLVPWDYLGLSFNISLWPGGSRGIVTPQLRSSGSDRVKARAQQPVHERLVLDCTLS